MVIDFDDFGCNHVISDQCQSHDCRDKLLELRKINPEFKVTLFAIPGEMTAELSAWCQLNRDWIEIAVHGFFHQSNYECEKLSYDDFDFFMDEFKDITKTCFVKGFKAPGWQISDDIYKWLLDHGYWVADQSYNNDRRPEELSVYLNRNGVFGTMLLEPNDITGKKIPYFHEVTAWHGHTWDCVGNGIYETFDQLSEVVKTAKDFRFISEVV